MSIVRCARTQTWCTNRRLYVESKYNETKALIDNSTASMITPPNHVEANLKSLGSLLPSINQRVRKTVYTPTVDSISSTNNVDTAVVNNLTKQCAVSVPSMATAKKPKRFVKCKVCKSGKVTDNSSSSNDDEANKASPRPPSQ